MGWEVIEHPSEVLNSGGKLACSDDPLTLLSIRTLQSLQNQGSAPSSVSLTFYVVLPVDGAEPWLGVFTGLQ